MFLTITFQCRNVARGRPYKTSEVRGGEVYPVGTFCGQGGGRLLQMRTSELFCAKNLGFFEIYGVSARTRADWASAEILQTRVRVVNFSRFCADVFYGRSIKNIR